MPLPLYELIVDRIQDLLICDCDIDGRMSSVGGAVRQLCRGSEVVSQSEPSDGNGLYRGRARSTGEDVKEEICECLT
jgi:hypothetical protein